MIRFLRTTLHPHWYQGRHRKPPYFEGWYYKLVDKSEQHRFAVIPGLFRGAEAGASHAFVQVLNGVTGQATYHRYPVGEFRAAETSFDLQVGPNRFTQTGMDMQIESAELSLSGELSFEGLTPWPVTVFSPGIMGWYAWMPFMQCYHGVVSLDHRIHGQLALDGQAMDFGGGRGYMEKDWGRSFPSAWIWMQSNHFAEEGTSFTASVAIIPWLRSSFRGFIIGLWHAGRLLRFATYTGARTEELAVADDDVHWIVSDRRYLLDIRASRSEAGLLRGPSGVDMGVRVPETLNATVTVRLWDRGGGNDTLVYEGTGLHGGLEVAGDLGRLLTTE
jgi:hypothetical protein